ncbi:MAG: hypothetical protein ACOX8X_02640 [Methanomethylophilus sp.]|jgi:hypothetical protein
MAVSSGITVTSTSANTLAGEYDFSGSGCITVSDGATLIIGDVTKIDSTVTDPIFVFEEGSSLAVMEDDSAVVIATFDEDTEVCFTGTIEETTTDASCSLTISEGAAVSVGDIALTFDSGCSATVEVSTDPAAVTFNADISAQMTAGSETSQISVSLTDLTISASASDTAASIALDGSLSVTAEDSYGNSSLNVDVDGLTVSVDGSEDGLSYAGGSITAELTANAAVDAAALPQHGHHHSDSEYTTTATLENFAADVNISGDSSTGNFSFSAGVSADTIALDMVSSSDSTDQRSFSLSGLSAEASFSTSDITALGSDSLTVAGLDIADASYDDDFVDAIDCLIDSGYVTEDDGTEIRTAVSSFDANEAYLYNATAIPYEAAYGLLAAMDEIVPDVAGSVAALGDTDFSFSASLDSLAVSEGEHGCTSSLTVDGISAAASSDGSSDSADVSASFSVDGISSAKTFQGSSVKSADLSLSASISGTVGFSSAAVTSYSFSADFASDGYIKAYMDDGYALVQADCSGSADYSDTAASATFTFNELREETSNNVQYIRDATASTDGTVSVGEAGCSGAFYGSAYGLPQGEESFEMTVTDVSGTMTGGVSIGSLDAVIDTAAGGTVTIDASGDSRTITASDGQVLYSDICFPSLVGDFAQVQLCVIPSGASATFEADDGSLYVANNIAIASDADVSGSFAVETYLDTSDQMVSAFWIQGGYLGVSYGDDGISYSIVADSCHTGTALEDGYSGFTYDADTGAVTLDTDDYVTLVASVATYRDFTVTVDGTAYTTTDGAVEITIPTKTSDSGNTLVPIIAYDENGYAYPIYESTDATTGETVYTLSIDHVVSDMTLTVSYAEVIEPDSDSYTAEADCIIFTLGAGESITITLSSGVIYEITNNGSSDAAVALMAVSTEFNGHDAYHLWFVNAGDLSTTVYIPTDDGSNMLYHVNGYGCGHIISSEAVTIDGNTYLKASPDSASYFYAAADPIADPSSDSDDDDNTAILAVAVIAIIAAVGACAYFVVKGTRSA